MSKVSRGSSWGSRRYILSAASRGCSRSRTSQTSASAPEPRRAVPPGPGTGSNRLLSSPRTVAGSPVSRRPAGCCSRVGGSSGAPGRCCSVVAGSVGAPGRRCAPGRCCNVVAGSAGAPGRCCSVVAGSSGQGPRCCHRVGGSRPGGVASFGRPGSAGSRTVGGSICRSWCGQSPSEFSILVQAQDGALDVQRQAQNLPGAKLPGVPVTGRRRGRCRSPRSCP